MLGDIYSTFKIWIQNENNFNTETIVLHSIPNGGKIYKSGVVILQWCKPKEGIISQLKAWLLFIIMAKK